MEKAVRGYSLNKIIYQNNFYTVYDAEHAVLKGQKLRITLINEVFVNNPSIRSAFNQNIMRLTFAEHKNMIANIDMLEENDNLAILSEHAEYSDFIDFLYQSSYNEKIQFCVEIFELIKYLHSRNIFVTDLRPENFVVNDAGKVLLSNVGLINIILQDSDKTVFESIGEELIFTAPEIIDFSLEPNAQSDIYSFGSFLELTFNEYLKNEIETDNFVISDLQRIIEKATSFDLKIRYKYLRDFQHELFNCLKPIDIENVEIEHFEREKPNSNVFGSNIDEADVEKIEAAKQKPVQDAEKHEQNISPEEPSTGKNASMNYHDILAGIEKEKKAKAAQSQKNTVKPNSEQRSSSTVYQSRNSPKEYNTSRAGKSNSSGASYNRPQSNTAQKNQKIDQKRQDTSRNSQSSNQSNQNSPQAKVNTTNVLVLGIIGVFFSFAIPFVGFILSIVGLAQIPKNKRKVRLQGRNFTSTEKSPQTVGIILCILALIVSAIRAIMWIVDIIGI